jgi:hypothetical protein
MAKNMAAWCQLLSIDDRAGVANQSDDPHTFDLLKQEPHQVVVADHFHDKVFRFWRLDSVPPE